MSGTLVKIDEVTVGSGVSSFEIGGANWSTDYDVYFVEFYNMQLTSTTSDARIKVRILKSDNSADTTSNYTYAFLGFRSGASFDNLPDTSQDSWTNFNYIWRGGTGFNSNGYLWLFNFNNASEYNFITNHSNAFGYDADELMGAIGGAVHETDQVAKGLHFFLTASTYAGGKCVLYGLRK